MEHPRSSAGAACEMLQGYDRSHLTAMAISFTQIQLCCKILTPTATKGRRNCRIMECPELGETHKDHPRSWRHLLVQSGSCSWHSSPLVHLFFPKPRALSFLCSAQAWTGQQGVVFKVFYFKFFKAFLRLLLSWRSSAVTSSPSWPLNSSLPSFPC